MATAKQRKPVKKPAAKMGRPRKEINFDELGKLAQMQCTQSEVAGWFEVSEDTIERRIREETGLTFAEYLREKGEGGKSALRRVQMQTALKGNPTMLIWLGKQYLGQTEKSDPNDSLRRVEVAYINTAADGAEA